MDIRDILNRVKEGKGEDVRDVLESLRNDGFEEELNSMALASAFAIDEETRLEAFNKIQKDTDLSHIKNILEKTNPETVRLINENLNETQQRVLYCLVHNALLEGEVAILCPILIMLERVVKPLIITVKNLTQVIGESKEVRG